MIFSQIPEVSEMMASWFGGGGSQSTADKKKKPKPLRR